MMDKTNQTTEQREQVLLGILQAGQPAPIGADALIDELEYAILGIPMARNFDRVRAAKAALRAALSTAAAQPPAGWKLVPVEPTDEMLKAADDGDDEYTLRNFGPGVQRVMQGPYDHYCAMLAASPTPPAEQQAQPGAVYAELPDFDSGDEPIWEAVFNWKAATPGSDAHKKAMAVESAIINSLRDFADRTHALRMEQAALKAATVKACVCGEPQAPGTVHRVAGPCYVAAPQQEAQEPTEIPEEIERMAADRYKVVPSHESMFHRWAVVAGTGTQQLYLGREVECQNMARKFAGAFLDGAFVAMQRTAPQPAPAPLIEEDPLQGAANWLAQAHGMFCPAVLQGCLMIGYNRAKRLHDAAIAAQERQP